MNRFFITLIAVGIGSAGAAAAQPLIGEPVPAIGDEVTWVHGQPIPEFAEGRIYVLDFWATWCPPCYPMFDLLSEIQNRYGEEDLWVIGIAVGTDVGMPLDSFLEREAHRISYTIAVPKDEAELKALLVHPSIMEPDNFGLPFLMIIDRQGRLAWVSDPYGPDDRFKESLAAVIVGSHDLKSERRAARRLLDLIAESDFEIERTRRLRREGQFEKAAEDLVLVAEQLPEKYADEAVDLYQQLLCSAEEELAAAYGRRLLNGALADRVSSLVQLERSILSLSVPGEPDLELAEAAARLALELKGGTHPDFLFELAKVLTARGRTNEAEEVRQQASSAAREQGWQDNYVRYTSKVELKTALRQQAAGFADTCENHEASW